MPGRMSLAFNYRGVTYYFANTQNRETFQQDPESFEPTYGGWCAWAMRRGAKVDIDPELYTLSGNRLHLFIAPAAKAKFDADVAGIEMKADSEWKRITGESPRF